LYFLVFLHFLGFLRVLCAIGRRQGAAHADEIADHQGAEMSKNQSTPLSKLVASLSWFHPAIQRRKRVCLRSFLSQRRPGAVWSNWRTAVATLPTCRRALALSGSTSSTAKYAHTASPNSPARVSASAWATPSRRSST